MQRQRADTAITIVASGTPAIDVELPSQMVTANGRGAAENARSLIRGQLHFRRPNAGQRRQRAQSVSL